MSARPARSSHPASGNLVTDVAIEHQLSTGAGHADLDVPGLTFGPNLQPDELTRLTEGVIALVNGTISGHGRIDWTATGEVTSTGDFTHRQPRPRGAVRPGRRG